MTSEDIAKIALQRAGEAASNVHKLRNELQTHVLEVTKSQADTERRIDRMDWNVTSLKEKLEEDSGRIDAVEDQQKTLDTASNKLLVSVERLQAKIHPPRHATEVAREAWSGVSRTQKLGFGAAVIALLSAPEFIKELFAFIVRIFEHR